MKNLLFGRFGWVLLLTAVLVSCERELSFENGGVPPPTGSTGGTSEFSFAGASGPCSGAIVSGLYTAGTAVGTANTVTLTVTVDSVGTWSVGTATVNGISFSGSGTFSTTGSQTITLRASGNPTAAGTFNYTAGSDGCTFSVDVTGGVVVPPAGCKDCEYVPTCVGSWYKYQTETFGTADTFRSTYLSTVDTLVGSITYAKMLLRTSTSTGDRDDFSYISCNNGESVAFQYNAVGAGGTTVAFLKVTGLKANLPVGGTWVDIIQNQTGQDVTNTFTIEEKGISRTVLGTAYSNVIHVHLVQTIDVPLIGAQEVGTAEYYYARGVGLVEFTSNNFGISSSRLLESYYIP